VDRDTIRSVSAYAKVNLGLRVGRRRSDGFHGLTSLFQSVSWHDTVEAGFADADTFRAEGDVRALDTTTNNLAWRALELVRREAGSERPIEAALTKRIPVAAGLGGGSADAAAALGLGAGMFDLPLERIEPLTAQLGSDVPFCLRGGAAIVEGRGEVIRPIDPPPAGYALALVVPPVTLLTSDVYRAWDRLDGPAGPPIREQTLPPSLRPYAPLANDLYPAAVALAPLVEEWAGELGERWGGAVAMSGSGPTLFGFFPTEGEAADAVSAIPPGARAARAVVPVREGWEPVH
jgi:4-diphosphocytidyl-2-C-methyl-D-erythritol kinase